MQAVIALCHFCETHGPRVVVVCQPMRATPSTSGRDMSNSSKDRETPTPTGQAQFNTEIEHHYMTRLDPESLSEDMPVFYGDWTKKAALDKEDRCKACSSLGPGPCLLSNDHVNRTTYVSSQTALQERVYERLRHACMRSLSCEISAPERPSASTSPSAEHPVLSSQAIRIVRAGEDEPMEIDQQHGDSNQDKMDGVVFFGDAENGYCFSLTFRVQDSKARGFLRLFSLIVVSNDMTFLTNNHEFFQNALSAVKERIQAEAAEVFYKEILAVYGNDVSRLKPTIHRRNYPPTTASADGGDEQMMHQNHGTDTSENPLFPLIRIGVGGRPEIGSFLSKLPMPAAWFKCKLEIDTTRNLQTITGDDQIWNTLHRQMMWTLRTQTLRCCDNVMEGVPTQDMLVLMEMDNDAICELDMNKPNQHEVTLQQLENLKLAARQMFEQSENDLDLLIKQVITGRLVVVQSDQRKLAKQLLLAMTNLLPIGCLRINTYMENCMDANGSYNMIGCPLSSVDMPLDALVLRIDGSYQTTTRENSISGCQISVLRRPLDERRTTNPQLLTRYKQLLLDNEINESVLDATIRSTREYWIGKAKLVYQMREQMERMPEKRIDVLQTVRGCSDHDVHVLDFWQHGLSQIYKRHVIATVDQQVTGNNSD